MPASIESLQEDLLDLNAEIQLWMRLRGLMESFLDAADRLNARSVSREEFERLHQRVTLHFRDEAARFQEGVRGVNNDIFGPLNDLDYARDNPKQARRRAMTHLDYRLEKVQLAKQDLEARIAASRDAAPKVGREGVFLAGQQFDAMMFVHDLITAAKSSIALIDSYVDAQVLKVLSARRAGVSIRVLTKSVNASLEAAAQAFNSQNGGLQLRTSVAFHDRILDIDEVDLYHLGGSIKDVGARRTSMFSRIEEPAVLATVRTEFQKAWQSATIVI